MPIINGTGNCSIGYSKASFHPQLKIQWCWTTSISLNGFIWQAIHKLLVHPHHHTSYLLWVASNKLLKVVLRVQKMQTLHNLSAGVSKGKVQFWVLLWNDGSVFFCPANCLAWFFISSEIRDAMDLTSSSSTSTFFPFRNTVSLMFKRLVDIFIHTSIDIYNARVACFSHYRMRSLVIVSKLNWFLLVDDFFHSGIKSLEMHYFSLDILGCCQEGRWDKFSEIDLYAVVPQVHSFAFDRATVCGVIGALRKTLFLLLSIYESQSSRMLWTDASTGDIGVDPFPLPVSIPVLIIRDLGKWCLAVQ